ncbi:MAG TPA: SIMPL domain-containing protein [Ignavibacteriales bacterium]|nr:SIMPL domain-containing protein [Ignavibacteriales bacterium]
MKERNLYLLPAAVLSAALIICAVILALTWRANRKADQTITVTGSAKKEITSDFGILRGSLSSRAPTAEEAFNELNRQKPILLEYLLSKGFPEDKVTFFTISSFPVYEVGPNRAQTGKIISYNYSQRIEVTSTDVNKIREMSLEISSLVKKGVSFMVEMPEYYYTKLADLKIQIQAEAAKDAINRGQRIAEATNRQLGAIKSARMGVLQITPKYSNMVSDYGVNDLSSIDKEITAVISASFQIE